MAPQKSSRLPADSFKTCEHAFGCAIIRAKQLCDLNKYLASSFKAALDLSDMLRAAIVLSISAFDYLIHELFRLEVLRRFEQKVPMQNFSIPINIAMQPIEEQLLLLDSYVRQANSHKTFVEPSKLGEALSCFVEHPWDKIAQSVGEDKDNLKSRIRVIYRWRNRITHEADIDPSYAGISLWPVNVEDVEAAIGDVERVGSGAVLVLRAAANLTPR